jgi:hypothetical protein
MRLPWDRPVVAVGDAPLLAVAAAVLRSQGVPVRRRADLSRGGIPRRAALLLLAAGEELPGQLRQARALVRGRLRSLRVVVLLQRAQTGTTDDAAEALTAFANEEAESALRVEPLDVDAAAARALLSRWPLHGAFDPPVALRPHVLIAGFGPFARALFLQVLRVGQYGEEPPVVTLAADQPDAWRDWVRHRHPQADACAELRFATLPSPVLAAPPLSTAAVCDLAPAEGLSTARGLIDGAAGAGGSPLVLLASPAARPADWSKGDLSDWDGQLVPVAPAALAFSRETLLEGRDDAFAEVIHEHYRDTSAAQGRDPAAESSGRPWALLGTSYRNANRHQADHLWAKLAVTDCCAVREELVESFAFAPTEVERLAIIEHRRWAVERWLDGWRYGAERDNARKLHPQLIPYAELSGPMQDLDRFAVRLVPALLARSGLGVVRRLVVGVHDGMTGLPAQTLERAAHLVLRRLVARHPDRGLTLALDPATTSARRVATVAVRHFGAGLFLLLPAPLSVTLAAQPEAERVALLGLLARAERRIQLADAAARDQWLARRAEVLLSLDAGVETMANGVVPPAKRVSLGARGDPRWSFEY